MAYQRVEILTGTERRRNYTLEEKLQMIEAAFRPGVMVSEAARQLGVHGSLLYRWRRDLTQGRPQSLGFASVEILSEPMSPMETPPLDSPRTASPPVSTGTVEILLAGGVQVRFVGGVDPDLAAAALSALVAPGRAS